MGEAWDQPYVQLQPWAFMPTAEGWSTLVDGFHQYPGYDGMRAVIATDWFSSLAMVYRLYGSARCASPTARRCCARSPFTARRWRWASRN